MHPKVGKEISTLFLACCAAVMPVHAQSAYPHSQEPIGTVRELYDGALTPDLTVSTLRNVDRLFPTRSVAPSVHPHPFDRSEKQITQVQFTADGKSYDLFDYLALDRIAAMLILKDGKIVNETYRSEEHTSELQSPA